METEPKGRVFEIGDPVVVVAERPLRGVVTGAHGILHVGAIDFVPQSFQGQKGWVSARSGSVYEVAFQMQEGHHRTALIHRWTDGIGISAQESQIDQGIGRLWEVQPDEIALECAPEGTFDLLMEAMYLAGDFDLDPMDVLGYAEDLLDAREAALEPEGYLARRRGTLTGLALEPSGIFQQELEKARSRWHQFKEGGWPSISGYIREYIEANDAGRLDWTPILSAIEQAEQGDRTGFEALLENLYVSGHDFLSLATGRPDPGVPTTACFDCDSIDPIADTWVSKRSGPLRTVLPKARGEWPRSAPTQPPSGVGLVMENHDAAMSVRPWPCRWRNSWSRRRLSP